MVKGLVSEFEGEDGPSGLPKFKPKSALSSRDKLRLGYTVGVEDPEAAPNKNAWTGNLLEAPTEVEE